MHKVETVKSDWDNDDADDTWDDWGDAEEFPAAQEQEEQKNVVKTNAAIQNNNNVNNRSSVKKEDPNDNKNLKNETVQQQQQTSNENQETPTNRPASWGLWGVLSKATEGLGNITNTVSQGLNQVIGVPDPEEMARLNAAEASKAKETKQKQPESNEPQEEHADSNAAPVFGLSLVSGVTSLGSKVLNTGLDTLEGIGKKTMHILQENDPLLKNKRKMLGLESDRPNLSEILQEARKDADQLENTLKELKLEKSKEQLRFEVIFENNCGLVHLEALEILSKESKLKLQTLLNSVSGVALKDLQETVNEVKELMELEDLEGESDGDYDAEALKELLITAIEDADLQTNFDDIISHWSKTLDWLATTSTTADEQAIFVKGITALAEMCALQVCKLHKIAELMLVKEHHSTANEVDGIVQLCKQFNVHLHGQTTRYATLLKDNESDTAKTHMSTLFAELMLATQQLEKAFQLFLPILQIGAV